MNDTNEKEIKLLDIQNITTIIFIGSLLVSIYITNVDKDTLINPDEKHPNTATISIFNRLLVLAVTLSFLYISYENRKLAIEKDENADLFNLQITASTFSTIAAIIVLYVVIKSVGQNYTIVAGITNPNL